MLLQSGATPPALSRCPCSGPPSDGWSTQARTTQPGPGDAHGQVAALCLTPHNPGGFGVSQEQRVDTWLLKSGQEGVIHELLVVVNRRRDDLQLVRSVLSAAKRPSPTDTCVCVYWLFRVSMQHSMYV